MNTTIPPRELNTTEVNIICIYPNPTTGIFTLSALFKKEGDIKIEIKNRLQKIMYSDQKLNASKEFETQINISHLSKGLYFLKITANENIYVRTIFKQ